MKLSLHTGTKILLVILFFAVSVTGFMIKLPAAFRHADKELHAAYYFIAAVFLNLLFANKNIWIHLLLFGCLYLFGVSIEHAQAWSNKFFHVRFHGRYDPEDVKYNLRGLLAFSICWIAVVGFLFITKKPANNEAGRP
ncbi:MAG: hypothetical protein ABI685_09085 [Ferruginibacter sp.]